VAGLLAEAWATMVGPELPEIGPWLRREGPNFDAVVFSGYMFSTSNEGIPAAAPVVPTVVQPVVHDEPYVRLPTARTLFDHVAGVCALTEEEADLIRRRFRPAGVVEVVGGGLGEVPELDDAVERFGLTGTDYVISIGRTDPGKGVPELVDYFAEYRTRHDRDVRLVLVGSNNAGLNRQDGVVFTGYVDDVTRWSLTAGATALIQPSYFESFSLSLAEGWQVGLPALVQGRCDVLAGQVRRSGGGLTYEDYAGFDAALTQLLADAPLRTALGEAGRRYVRRYDWDRVLDAFEQCILDAIDWWQTSRASEGGPVGGGPDGSEEGE
jgi:glycosyltransferase involved in cell wall biosynthesis